MIQTLFAAIIAAAFFGSALAECPNACSAHGKCGAYDMCICYRNWMANDCSERVCQFGRAHVDSPLGDLDSTGGALSSPSSTVITNNFIYPYGTQEQYPNMVDTTGTVLHNTAHQYTECSNKGICDRSTGTCSCFPGYEGSACQRASCPSNSQGVCSGHGVCESIRLIAERDFDNIYKLWDRDSTMGCVCDGGYTGSDCSQKICKYGADPLYYDDIANIRYSNFTYEIFTYASTTITGNYSLWFEDHTGEDWQTDPIPITATCTEVTDALEALPNNVIPSGTVRCYQHPLYASTNVPIYDSNIYIGGSNSLTNYPKFTLAFPGNPGYLKQIRINKYLDGNRPTLYTSETTSTLGWHIYVNGFAGEDTDIVPDYCAGVTVTLATTNAASGYHQLAGITTAEAKLLKACLGDSNGDSTDNVEVYNWDYGVASKTVQKVLNSAFTITMTYSNPHLIKLIDATQNTVVADDALQPYPKTQLCASVEDYVSSYYGFGWCANRNPPGFYAVLFYHSSTDTFRIFTRAGQDYDTTTPFYVYTTTGYLQRVSPVSEALSYPMSDSAFQRVYRYHSNTMYVRNHTIGSLPNGYFDNDYFGNVDCETNPVGSGTYAAACLNKDDYVMFLNVDLNSAGLLANPVYPNIYKVKKIFKDLPDTDLLTSQNLRHKIVLDFGTNHLFTNSVPSAIYKFIPPTNADKGFNYVGQCSNRGLCDTTTGICNCFNGFTGDNCGSQDALAA